MAAYLARTTCKSMAIAADMSRILSTSSRISHASINPFGSFRRGYASKPRRQEFQSPELWVIVGSAIVLGGASIYLRDSSSNITSATDESTSSSNEVAKPVLPPPPPPPPLKAKYVLIGAGTASFAAMKAIRQRDRDAKILIIGDEPDTPYMRPPLSKELWFTPDDSEDPTVSLKFKDWAGKQRSVPYESRGFFHDANTFCSITIEDDDDKKDESVATNDNGEISGPSVPAKKRQGGIALLTNTRAIGMDVYNKFILLDNGQEVFYEKVLIATGGNPKNLGVLKNVESSVSTFRRLDDFRQLYRATEKPKDIIIVGGGFLGSELAVALAKHAETTGGTVTQIFKEEANMSKVFPQYLAKWTSRQMKKQGVNLMTEAVISSAEHLESGKVRVVLKDGKTLDADHIVAAIGIEPDVSLAASAGLEVHPTEGGIVCNAELEARRDVWVAGDVSCFHDISLGRRRVEHHDHAVVSGRLAGQNMADDRRPYEHQSMFWSDLGPRIGYEAIGVVDSSLKTVGVWAQVGAGDTPAAALAAAVQADDESSAQVKTDDPVDVAEKVLEYSQAAPVVEPANGDQFGKGVIFYLRDDRVVGVLLWNVFNKVGIARRLIKEARQVGDLKELVPLFNVHDASE